MAKPDQMKSYTISDLKELMAAMKDNGIAMFELGDLKMGHAVMRPTASAANNIVPATTTDQAFAAVAQARAEIARNQSERARAKGSAASNIGPQPVSRLAEDIYKKAVQTAPRPTPTQPTGDSNDTSGR